MLRGRLGVVVADVTGHGIGPALLMAETRAYLRLLALNREDVGEILTRANRVLAEDIGYERFITMLLVSLDPKARMLSCANAGHPPDTFQQPRRNQNAIEAQRAFPLGLKPDTHYPPGTGVKLERGDTVLLLTDGIDEAMSPDNTIFGIERALEIVRAHRNKSARELVETLYAGVRQFSQKHPATGRRDRRGHQGGLNSSEIC